MTTPRNSGKPWKALRPGVAAVRCPPESTYTMVVFDVPSDRARRKLGEICKDYGLVRFQWSAFEGDMTRNRREELFDRACQLLNEAEGAGKLLITPVAAREHANEMRFAAEREATEKKAV